MRILFLSTSMGMGGADKQLLSAALEMQAVKRKLFTSFLEKRSA